VTTPTGPDQIRWAPRVNPSLIRRLYESDARGIVDDDLIDKVGFALYARCQSILEVTEGHERRRVKCPRCGQIVVRPGGPSEKGAVVSCESCAWSVRWGDYLKTHQDKRLHGGGALALFEAFVREFENARVPSQKMLAIDRLIHSFHSELVQNPGRTVATNLIYAKNKREVLTFLDTLSYGEASTPGLRENKKEWKHKLEQSSQPIESSFAASTRGGAV
jgi:predicted RNA-binding Zn-ribbon protein involved in translation (DUF1610 family)